MDGANIKAALGGVLHVFKELNSRLGHVVTRTKDGRRVLNLARAMRILVGKADVAIVIEKPNSSFGCLRTGRVRDNLHFDWIGLVCKGELC